MLSQLYSDSVVVLYSSTFNKQYTQFYRARTNLVARVKGFGSEGMPKVLLKSLTRSVRHTYSSLKSGAYASVGETESKVVGSLDLDLVGLCVFRRLLRLSGEYSATIVFPDYDRLVHTVSRGTPQ